MQMTPALKKHFEWKGKNKAYCKDVEYYSVDYSYNCCIHYVAVDI